MARKRREVFRLVQIGAKSLHEFTNLLTAHFGDLNKVPWEQVNVDHDFDYGGCYYEGDTPSVELTFSLTFEEKV